MKRQYQQNVFKTFNSAAIIEMLAMARQGLFLITLLLILPRFLSLDGIIYSQPLADLLTVAVTLILLAANSRKLVQEERE